MAHIDSRDAVLIRVARYATTWSPERCAEFARFAGAQYTWQRVAHWDSQHFGDAIRAWAKAFPEEG